MIEEGLLMDMFNAMTRLNKWANTTAIKGQRSYPFSIRVGNKFAHLMMQRDNLDIVMYDPTDDVRTWHRDEQETIEDYVIRLLSSNNWDLAMEGDGTVRAIAL